MAGKYKLTLTIDRDTCAGCGTCEALAPEYFKLGDDGKAEVLKPVIEGTKEEVDKAVSEIQEAVDTCPVEAISYKVEEVE